MGKNPNLVIKTPRGSVVRVETKGGKIEARLDWKPKFAPEMTQRLQTGQAMFDQEVMKQMQPYMQLDSSMMIKSMMLATDVGSGFIRVKTPYARRVYYSKASVGRQTGALRGPRYFDRMKADKLMYLVNFFKKAVDSK